MCACERCGKTEGTSKYVERSVVSEEVEALECEMQLCPVCADAMAETTGWFDGLFSTDLFGELKRMAE